MLNVDDVADCRRSLALLYGAGMQGSAMHRLLAAYDRLFAPSVEMAA